MRAKLVSSTVLVLFAMAAVTLEAMISQSDCSLGGGRDTVSPSGKVQCEGGTFDGEAVDLGGYVFPVEVGVPGGGRAPGAYEGPGSSMWHYSYQEWEEYRHRRRAPRGDIIVDRVPRPGPDGQVPQAPVGEPNAGPVDCTADGTCVDSSGQQATQQGVSQLCALIGGEVGLSAALLEDREGQEMAGHAALGMATTAAATYGFGATLRAGWQTAGYLGLFQATAQWIEGFLSPVPVPQATVLPIVSSPAARAAIEARGPALGIGAFRKVPGGPVFYLDRATGTYRPSTTSPLFREPTEDLGTRWQYTGNVGPYQIYLDTSGPPGQVQRRGVECRANR